MGKRSSTKGWSRKARKRHRLDKHSDTVDNNVYRQFVEKFGHKMSEYRRYNLTDRKVVARNLYSSYVFDGFPDCEFPYVVKTQIEKLLNIKNVLKMEQSEISEYFYFCHRNRKITYNFELTIELN